jgi:hypothetical protein
MVPMGADVAATQVRAAVLVALGALGAALALTACHSASAPGGIGPEPPSGTGPAVPRPRHTVVVVFENQPDDAIIGASAASYLN